MATTAQQVISRARQLLLDDKEPYRRDDARLMEYLNHGGRKTVDERADLAQAATGLITAWTTISAVASNISLPDSQLESLAHYIAHLALSEGNADDGNAAQAGQHLELYEAKR